MFDGDEDEKPEVQQTSIPDPSPVFPTAEHEDIFKKLSRKVFDMEEPCYDLEALGDVML